MYEVPAIIGACTNCIAPANLVATFATILVGALIAIHSQRRNQRHVGQNPIRARAIPLNAMGDGPLAATG